MLLEHYKQLSDSITSSFLVQTLHFIKGYASYKITRGDIIILKNTTFAKLLLVLAPYYHQYYIPPERVQYFSIQQPAKVAQLANVQAFIHRKTYLLPLSIMFI